MGLAHKSTAARLAVNQINEKGTLLPNKVLRMLSFDTVTEERPTVRATLSLCDDYKVLGIVGAASSTESTAAALLAEIFDTSLISYASTSATLSDKERFRTFYRTVPPDSFQARAIVDICKTAGWKHVTIIHTNDAYGTALSTQFQSNAAEAGIGVNQTLTIQTTGTSATIAEALAEQMAKINGKLEKIFVVFGLAADAAKVLINARDLGLLDGKHAFVGVDGVMQEALLTLLNSTSMSSTPAAAHRLAAGVLGTQPSSGRSREFQELLDLWRQQNASQYAGSGPGTTPNLFAPFAWDCVYTYAHAIARVLKKNNNNDAFLNAANITEELKFTNITGSTGPISFDRNGDREGSSYDIRNFQLQEDGTVKLITVGSWNPSQGVSYVSGAEVQYSVNIQNPVKVIDPAEVGTVACGQFEVSLGATCLACDDLEIFVPAANGEGARCGSCGASYHPSSDRVTCVLDDGIVALIAILVILAVLGALAAAFVLYRRVTKRRAEEERVAMTAPAVMWEVSDELAELNGETPGTTAAGVTSTLDKSAPVTVLMKVGEVPTFGVSKGSRMPVMELLTDTIVITNRGGQDISYVVSVPNGNSAYECTVLPGVGVVKKHSSRELTMRFKLMQTMKVDRHVKVVVEGHGNVYFPLRFEGELSQRLDPDEIELFGKPIGDGAFGTVYRGRYRGTAVAVKVLRRQNELAADQNNNFLKEITLFQKLRNPYIVSFIGASYIPGKLCIAEGTPVQLADGTARPIEQLAEARGASVRVASPKVVVHDAAGSKRARQGAVVIESARCSDGWFSGVKECVQLTLEDGRTLVCTADHEVLAADGVWLQAGDAKVGVTRLAVAARDAPLDVADECDGAFEVARCALRMDGGDSAARRRALAFARQLGAGAASSGSAAVDREAVASDSALLGDAERVAAVARDADGVERAPRAFVREFVAARVGGAVWSLNVAASGAVLRAASAEEAACVGTLLAQLGVAAQRDGVELALDAEAALQFAEQVGVRYSVAKQVRLAHAAVAWRGARAFARQRAWIAKRADELAATSMSLVAARSRATSELAAREALLTAAPAFDAAPVSLLSAEQAAAPTLALRVVDVRAAGARRVYDLSVPGNTSFVANGVAVHNCICTELLERGTVLELIQKARISLALKYKLMLDTAGAVDFLHSNGVLYRDLKPDNLLVFSVSHNASVNCKLSDFGTSRIVDDPKVPMQHTSGIGTPIYMAPEMMDATQKYTLKVDVYSFGMLCWELMAEKQPFNEVKRIWDLPRIVVDGLRPTIDESWPRPIQRLIAEAWMHSAERRPTMKEMLAVLQELFESERRNYEKSKKNRKGEDELADPARPRTAHTGNLEELIQKSGADPSPPTVDTAEMARAPDVEGGDNSAWEPAAKKKTKKKVAKE
jgi:serine/threonine protein kinase/ABC-type branched-subunit amino acid transport system substrate-binding protein/type II secretory pathway pseudopilin PulG